MENQEVFPLARSVSRADLDFCSVTRSGVLRLYPIVVPNNFSMEFTGQVNMVVSVQVRANECDSGIYKAHIYWDGKWEDGDAEMAKHLVLDDRSAVA